MTQPCLRRRSRVLPGAHIVVHSSLEGLEDVWRALAARSACHVFQTWEWNATWMACIGEAGGIAPRVVRVLDEQGETLALWPLAIYRRGRLRVLAFMGDIVSDYRAPLLAPAWADRVSPSGFERLWRECWRAVAGVDMVVLDRMPGLLGDRPNPMAGLRGARHAENAHAVSLPASASDYLATRSTQMLSANRRGVRRLAEMGELSFTPRHDDAASRAEVLAAVVRQKSRRWQETGSPDLFARAPYLAFYRTLTERYADSGLITLCSLRVGETIVAAQWGAISHGRYYWILPGYEPGAWAKYSCGRIMLQHMIEWSIGQGMTVFDLTVGDEGYKKDWADVLLPLYRWRAARTPAGWVGLAYGHAREAARATPWIRRLVQRAKRWRER